MFDSTVYQKIDSGITFLQCLTNRGIVPEIKGDQGLKPLAGCKTAFITEGLYNLGQRCAEYKKQGCQFTKWRSVLRINSESSSYVGLKENSVNMARYAKICQHRLVPIMEPEMLPLGEHDVEVCQKVMEEVLSSLFRALHKQHVYLEGIIFKSNMVTLGQTSKKRATPEEIAKHTVTAFQRTVPRAVPIIVLLSGGQTEEDATTHLDAISKYKGNGSSLSVTALQASAFKVWLGKKENIARGQQEFLNRAKANSEAALGKYRAETVKGKVHKDQLKIDGVHEY